MAEGKKPQDTSMTDEKKEDKVIKIRPLNMTDFREAKNQVSTKTSTEFMLNPRT